MALGVLVPLGWPPKCREGQIRNNGKALPPGISAARPHIGPIAEGSEEEIRVEIGFVDWDARQSAHTMVAITDDIGMTVCLIALRGEIVHHNISLHWGMMVGRPAYLTEVALTRAL